MHTSRGTHLPMHVLPRPAMYICARARTRTYEGTVGRREKKLGKAPPTMDNHLSWSGGNWKLCTRQATCDPVPSHHWIPSLPFHHVQPNGWTSRAPLLSHLGSHHDRHDPWASTWTWANSSARNTETVLHVKPPTLAAPAAGLQSPGQRTPMARVAFRPVTHSKPVIAPAQPAC